MLSWRVNLVAQDTVLVERLKLHLKREPQLQLHYSTAPEKKEIDIYILPADLLDSVAELKLERIDKWLPVIAYGSHLFLWKAFLNGCYDYLKDPWSPQELLLRLERLIAQLEKQHIYVYGSLSFKGNSLTSGAGHTLLSWQESRLLKLLFRQAGTVVTREALFYTIWDRPPAAESRVIDVHISAIKRKLKAHGLSRIIRSVRGQGYMLEAEPEPEPEKR